MNRLFHTLGVKQASHVGQASVGRGMVWYHWVYRRQENGST